MTQYILSRLFIAFLVIATVSVISFMLLRISGDLALELAGEDATQEQIAETARLYGLDQPLYVQYFDWVGNALRGDFGHSLYTSEPVIEMIASRIGRTFKLAFYAMILALTISIPLGVIASLRPNSWLDRGALLFAVFAQAIPSFWFALLLMLFFGVSLRWLPISGSSTELHFLMPSVALGLSVMPQFMRLTRAGMLDVLGADFIRTARAKGLNPWKVYFKHALRVAMLPLLSLIAIVFGFLLSGSVVMETIFSLNGVGSLAFESIIRQDFPVLQSIVLMISVIYVSLTFFADLLNAQLDPRIRVDG